MAPGNSPLSPELQRQAPQDRKAATMAAPKARASAGPKKRTAAKKAPEPRQKTPEEVKQEEAQALVANLSGPMAPRALEIALHVLTLEAKAKECRRYIEQLPPFFVSRYYNDEVDENGNLKPHTSVKPNPAMGVYQSILASYNAELGQLEHMLEAAPPSAETGTTTLTRLRALNGGKKAG